MDFKKYSSWKRIVGILIVVATAMWIGLSTIYDFARERYDRLMVLQERAVIMSVKNNLLLSGFFPVPASEMAMGANRKDEIWFIGHIYPQNEIQYRNKPTFPALERPLSFILSLSKQAPPGRVFFGGDSIWSPTRESLDSLETLKAALPMARFVLGNHEKYYEVDTKQRTRFTNIFGNPYGYEDFHGVRLVYLHSVSRNGTYGINAEQRKFLTETLTGSGYDYALLFLHHALWAGHTIYTNTAYVNAEALASDWVQGILPILKKGNVKAVFSGDGGWRTPGRRFLIRGVPHYITGWSGRRVDILPEWLTITLDEDDVAISWNRLFMGEQYVRKELKDASSEIP